MARLLVPLLIPRIPLVIVAALVLDAVDNSVLAALTDVDLGPDGPYQSFDKALDIYYLTIAYLSTLRNWTSDPAIRIAQFLFYYRLVGVLLFELSDSRSMLLIFPNTFEYFFLLYELIRLRFDPIRFPARFWLVAAAAIWVLVKLPQEYWIHVAQRDFTEAIAESPLLGVACAIGFLALVEVLLFVVRPRLPRPDWGWRLLASTPTPVDDPVAVREDRRRTGHLVWSELVEKVVLVALLAVIFAEILSGVTTTPLEVTVAAIAIVCLNTGLGTWRARSASTTLERTAAWAALLLVSNLLLVFVASRMIGDRDDFPLGEGLFFAFLVTLIVSLYDAYKPLYEARFGETDERVRSLRDLVSAGGPRMRR